MKGMSMRVVLPLVLAGCGPDAAIWLRVEAPFTVPDQVNALRVQAQTPANTVLFDHNYDLSKGPQFPLTLTLTNSDSVNLGSTGVNVTASALSGSALAQPWSQASGNVVLVKGEIVALTLQICECP